MNEPTGQRLIPSGGISASLADQGRWLFRWRSFLPIATFPILVADFFVTADRGLAPELSRVILAGLLLLLGLALRILVSGTARAGSSGRNTRRIKAYELEMTGAYSLCRNPVYLGNLLMTLGVLSFTASANLIVLTILSFWLYYERIIAAEEALLHEQFGAAYEAFASSRPVFIPRLRGWQAPYQGFSWKAALRREYTTVASAAVVACALLTLRELAYTQSLSFQLWHQITAGVLVVYLLLRTIKKTTRFMRLDQDVRSCSEGSEHAPSPLRCADADANDPTHESEPLHGSSPQTDKVLEEQDAPRLPQSHNDAAASHASESHEAVLENLSS